jgi:hypothetical protein
MALYVPKLLFGSARAAFMVIYFFLNQILTFKFGAEGRNFLQAIEFSYVNAMVFESSKRANAVHGRSAV